MEGVVRMAVLEATCGPENRAPTPGGKQINAFHVCCKHMLILMEKLKFNVYFNIFYGARLASVQVRASSLGATNLIIIQQHR